MLLFAHWATSKAPARCSSLHCVPPFCPCSPASPIPLPRHQPTRVAPKRRAAVPPAPLRHSPPLPPGRIVFVCVAAGKPCRLHGDGAAHHARSLNPMHPNAHGPAQTDPSRGASHAFGQRYSANGATARPRRRRPSARHHAKSSDASCFGNPHQAPRAPST